MSGGRLENGFVEDFEAARSRPSRVNLFADYSGSLTFAQPM